MKKRYIVEVADQSAVAPGSSLASGGAMTKLMACLVLVFLVLVLGFGGSAHADVVYVWKTLSATVDGQPTDLTASGKITLTDAGFSQGFGSVTTTSIGGTMVNQILDGVVSASFQMFDGPDLITGNTNVLVNLIATVHDQYLDVTAEGGPFFVNAVDTDAYFTIGSGIIYYGTDNQNSPCLGSELPGGSHCMVTGVFERVVPEPGTFPISLAALGLFTLIAARTRRS